MLQVVIYASFNLEKELNFFGAGEVARKEEVQSKLPSSIVVFIG